MAGEEQVALARICTHVNVSARQCFTNMNASEDPKRRTKAWKQWFGSLLSRAAVRIWWRRFARSFGDAERLRRSPDQNLPAHFRVVYRTLSNPSDARLYDPPLIC